MEARRGSAGGQQAQSFELLVGFFSGEKVAGNGQCAGFTCFDELIIRLSTETILAERSSSPSYVAGLWARERGQKRLWNPRRQELPAPRFFITEKERSPSPGIISQVSTFGPSGSSRTGYSTDCQGG